jgi:hypothetical protein
VHETKFGETNPFGFHSQQIGIALIQTKIDIMGQIKLGIFDLERQDRERERFAHERGQLLTVLVQILIIHQLLQSFQNLNTLQISL